MMPWHQQLFANPPPFVFCAFEFSRTFISVPNLYWRLTKPIVFDFFIKKSDDVLQIFSNFLFNGRATYGSEWNKKYLHTTYDCKSWLSVPAFPITLYLAICFQPGKVGTLETCRRKHSKRSSEASSSSHAINFNAIFS